MSALEKLMQKEERVTIPLPSSKKDEIITGTEIGKRLAEAVIGPFKRDIKAMKIKFHRSKPYKVDETKN